jgi:hypothetical protein
VHALQDRSHDRQARPSDRLTRDPLKKEKIMLKTISAALLAVSVLAAPALAAGQVKSTQAPTNKAEQAKQVQPNAMNAKAKMGHHHVRHARHYHSHKNIGALKTQKFSKVSIKHITPTSKRG